MRYAFIAMLITACGGQKLDGTIIGASFSLNSSASEAGDGAVSFVLSSVDNICGSLSGNGDVPDSQTLSIALRNTDASGGPAAIVSGPYVVNGASGKVGTVFYRKYGDNCSDPDVESADSGTVTIDTIDDTTGQLSGSIDLVFGSDHLSGSITADACGHFNNATCIPPAP